MNFSNYPDFRNRLHVLLDSDDISTSDLSTDVLDTIIGIGEQRIYRDLRSSTQDAALTAVTANNLATLPADFLELKGAPFVAPFAVTIYMPWEILQNKIQQLPQSPASPVYYSFQSDAMIFYPVQPDGTVVTGQYYRRYPDLVIGLNPLFLRHPDVFLYAALASGGSFLGEQERTPAWEAQYMQLVEQANEQERRRYTRGSKLATRVG